MGNIGELIRRMIGFFTGMGDAVVLTIVSPTPMGVISFVWAIGCIVGMYFTLKKIIQSHHGTLNTLMEESFHLIARAVLIWLFVGVAPAMLAGIGQGLVSTIKPLPASMADSSAALAQAHADNIKVIWYSQMTIQHDLAMENPFLYDGLQNTNEVLKDADIVKQTLDKQKKVASVQIDEQLTQAKALMASSDPKEQKRGRQLQTQAKQAKMDLDRGVDGAAANVTEAKGNVEQTNSVAGGIAAGIRGVFFSVTAGFTEILFLIKRLVAGGYGLVAILLPLLFSLMALWKLLQSLMEVFSYLVTYLIMVKIGISIGIVLAPLFLLTFWTTEFRKYGHAVLSSWLQMTGGVLGLVAGVKLAVVGFTSLAGLTATMGATIYTAIALSNPTMSGKIVGGMTAAFGVFMSAISVQLLASIIQKSPTAGIGMVSGSWHA